MSFDEDVKRFEEAMDELDRQAVLEARRKLIERDYADPETRQMVRLVIVAAAALGIGLTLLLGTHGCAPAPQHVQAAVVDTLDSGDAKDEWTNW